VSNERGEFACSGLDPGHYTGALYVQGVAQRSAPELTLDRSGEPPSVRLRADASASIRVRLEGSGNAPVAALSAFACRAGGESLIARRDGRDFLFERLALGRYEVHLGPSPCGSATAADVTLESDGQLADVSLQLPRLARVHGRLVDTRGVPVPDAWVSIADPHPAWGLLSETTPPVVTDAEGQFSLSGLVPGRYELSARAAFNGGSMRQSVEVAPGDAREVVLALEPPAPAEDPSPPSMRPVANNTNRGTQ
jgi:hypothetical protein